MKRSILAGLMLVGALLAVSPASAQGCGDANPGCIVPTAPISTTDKRAASTEFVQQAISGGGTGTYSPGQVLGNGTGSTAAPTPTQLPPIIDQSICATRGSVLERSATGWACTVPGTSGLPWVSNGAGADSGYAALTTPNVNFTQSGTGASTRTLDSRLKEGALSIVDFGADPTGATDSTTAIQNAFNATPTNGALFVPPGSYLIAGALTRNTPIHLFGAGQEASQFVVKTGTLSTTNIFAFTPATATRGWRFHDFGIVGQSGASLGQHALFFNIGSSASADNVYIDHLLIFPTAGGQSIRVTNANTLGGFFLSGISDCNLESINLTNVGDTISIRNNAITSTTTNNIGVYAYQVAGAGNLQIVGNNIAVGNAAIVFDGGTAPIIRDNEIETPSGITNSAGYVVNMLATQSAISVAEFINNQVQVLSGTGNPVPLIVGNGTNAVQNFQLRGGRISNQTGNQITVGSNSANAYIDIDTQFSAAGTIGPVVIGDTGVNTTHDVGQYIQSVVASGSAVSLTTTTAANMTSISLPPGTWDVNANIEYTGTATSVSGVLSSISTTSTTLSDSGGRETVLPNALASPFATLGILTTTLGPLRIAPGSTVTVFAVAECVFSGGTCTTYGILRARRVCNLSNC